MASTLDEARPAVADLVERFARNLAAYRRSTYNEAQVRAEYIDPSRARCRARWPHPPQAIAPCR